MVDDAAPPRPVVAPLAAPPAPPLPVLIPVKELAVESLAAKLDEPAPPAPPAPVAPLPPAPDPPVAV